MHQFLHVAVAEGYAHGKAAGGFGGEIAALAAEEAFSYLKAPVKRVTAPDIPVPFSPPLEQFYIPNENQLIEAVKSIVV